ncbi:helix-turn-helix domain-containing protein [Croceicoccus sp. YJ47]|uniref:helix-turn-helix domain-containing protein n=1 Tax=Croceicoccus sp. YJ47 TaxID=2798724 RepID=UPI0019251390|nr:helix-turn-helix domain-containing protein [Croceicoccus sp. YJ47]QQN73933.1 hypothetical protein JD971_14480 [Croceicoccus sp. YJ47]
MILSADLLYHTAVVFGVSVDDLRGPRRFKEYTVPRSAYSYLARELAGRSFPSIGRTLGGRDHSTIINGHRNIKRAVERCGVLAEALGIIRHRAIKTAEQRKVNPLARPEDTPLPERVFFLLDGHEGVWIRADDARAMIASMTQKKREIYHEFVAWKSTLPDEKEPEAPVRRTKILAFTPSKPETPLHELDEDEYLDRLAQIAMSKEDA